MSKISEKLVNKNSNVKNGELIDYVISFQLNKIEGYTIKNDNIVDENTEKAMANLVELLKIRSGFKF